jgi:hypothetical protein
MVSKNFTTSFEGLLWQYSGSQQLPINSSSQGVRVESVGMFLMLAIGVALYFLPLIIASIRQHPSAVAISALNLLVGWTFIGWVAALVWSLNSVAPQTATATERTSSAADLYKLAELREKNLITQDEFEREKAKIR